MKLLSLSQLNFTRPALLSTIAQLKLAASVAANKDLKRPMPLFWCGAKKNRASIPIFRHPRPTIPAK